MCWFQEAAPLDRKPVARGDDRRGMLAGLEKVVTSGRNSSDSFATVQRFPPVMGIEQIAAPHHLVKIRDAFETLQLY